MPILISLIIGLLPCVTALSGSPLVTEIPPDQWQPHPGDRMIVDTRDNEGFLIRQNGEYLRFPVVTGRRSSVTYIGRRYNATTPVREWEVASKEIKGDHITFGPTGRFFRLSTDNSDERTAYGIHEYGYEEKMFAESVRYLSMGCIIVRSKILDIIERTYDINEGHLAVSTQYGLDPDLFVLR
ncbi:MAG: L,D-transpeptidase [Candidatus Peregrinibacteria bacterium]